MHIGMVGLGRMGANMVRRLMRANHTCVVHDVNPDAIATLVSEGARGASTLEALVEQLPAPRIVWLMVPAAIVGRVVDQVAALLHSGDVIVDGGNTHYQQAIAKARSLKERGIHFVDVGTSGGVFGLENGYCLMIGGEKAVVASLEPVFRALAPGRKQESSASGGKADVSTAEQGYLHCGPAGAGHFVKMVHNGIEYALMAAYAEGFNLLAHADRGLARHEADAETAPLDEPEHYQYQFNIPAIAELWRHGSVVRSWLLDLTAAALRENPDLEGFSGRVSDSGEGRWTLKACIDVGTPMPTLAAALFERFDSRGASLYANKLLSAMRLMFGGHREKT
ncbi:MAG TPA: decarboxylating 6-phosphogluconate dehydrogenase [Steroidobacteraceae bacterium]